MFESLRLLHTAGLCKRGRDDEETGSQEHRQAVGGVHSLRACLRCHGVHAPRYTILIDSTYFFFALPTFTCSISFFGSSHFLFTRPVLLVCLIHSLFALHTYLLRPLLVCPTYCLFAVLNSFLPYPCPVCYAYFFLIALRTS